MRLTYDPNGNIKTLNRFGVVKTGNAGVTTAMDNLTYNYQSGSNKLTHVDDNINKNNFDNDIDDQDPNNYTYDAIGNLIKDNAEEIQNITWNVYGKMTSVVNIKKERSLNFYYDASGNRVKKIDGKDKATYYVRDAQGNVMAVYEKEKNKDIFAQSFYIYGSSRIGEVDTAVNMQTATVSTTSFSRMRGIKRYEMSNHLGNVMVVVSDRKVYDGSVFKADLVSSTDYYAFGMVMSDRSWNTEGYRYGFNGQEKSPEIAEGHTTALYWEYDSRLGRRWNLDPVATAFESEYAVNGNNPIYYVDPNGDFKTKFGAKIYNFFHGGKGEVKQAGIGDKKHAGEWYVGKSVEHKDKIGGVTYQRKFSSDNEADNIADKGIDIGEKAIDVAKNSEYVVEGKVKVSAGAQIGIKGTWFGLEGKAEAGLLTFDLYEAKYDFIKMKGSHGRSEKRIHNFIGFSGTLFSEKLSIGGKYDYTFLYDINYYGGIGMVKDSDTHDWTVNLPLKSFGPKINLSPRIDARLKVNRTAQVANNKQFYGIDVGAGVKFIFGVDVKLKLGLKL